MQSGSISLILHSVRVDHAIKRPIVNVLQVIVSNQSVISRKELKSLIAIPSKEN